MKKILLFIAAITIAVCAYAQKGYDSDYKYSLWSNLSIGGSASYNRAVFTDNAYNIGMDLRMTKRIHDNWRVRGIADINGFIGNGFDRYCKLMAGVSLDFMPFYLFLDYGANYNPNNLGHQKFGLAGDAGIGLGWDYFHLEAGIDRVNNGTYWQSNAFAKMGVDVPLGITEDDAKKISHEKKIHQEYGELVDQNRLLKSEQQKILEANSQLEATLTRATELCDKLEQKLKDCESDKAELEASSCEDMVIYFDFASSCIMESEIDKLDRIAEYIKSSNDKFTISGYCSNNGSDTSNKVLSQDRAWAVSDALQARGVSYKSITQIEGFGKAEYNSFTEQKVVITKVK